MINKRFKLKQYYSAVTSNAYMDVYIPENTSELNRDKIPLVIIFPGGGYKLTSDREAEPVALAFNGRGIASAVVRYSCAPVRYPMQLFEGAAAIALCRKNAAEWGVDENKIITCGFSAGGHCAGMASIFGTDPLVCRALGEEASIFRANGMILCYPVITSGKNAHRSSFENLIGECSDDMLFEKLSLEKSVREDTPPAFVWHSSNDDCVPCENSILMASALSEHNIPFELHIFNGKGHGTSLCDERTYSGKSENIDNACCKWFDLCIKWLKSTI